MGYVLHYLAASLAWAWLLFVPGAWLDLLAARRGLWPGGDPLVRFTLGIAAWLVALFSAATSGLLDPRGFRALAVGVAGLGAVWAWRRRSALRFEWSTRRALLALVPSAAFLYVLSVVFLLAIRPGVAWDADTYHLTVPRLYVEHGGFRAIPLNVYSNWPLAVDLLFGLGLMLGDHVTATLLHFVLGVLTALGVHRYVSRRAPRWAAIAAVAFFLGNRLVQYEMSIAYVELGIAFFFLQACAWLLASLEDPAHERGWLLLTGIACGLLASTKHTGLVGVLAVGLAYLAVRVVPRPRSPAMGTRLGALRRGLVYLALPAFVLVLPWYVKSWWYTGNPVYPFLHEVLGGVDWNAELSRQHAAWHASFGVGRDWGRLLQLPWIVFSSGAEAYPRFQGTLAPLWSVLLPFSLVLSIGRRAIALPLVAATVYFWLWALSSQQMRFLVAILPLLSVAAGLALARFVTWPRRPFLWLGPLAVVCALAPLLASVTPSAASAHRWLSRYRAEGPAVLESAVHPRWKAIERLVPPDGKLLFVNTNHAFFCRRAYVADSFFEASQVSQMLRPFESVGDLHAFLRASGFTHILHHPPFRAMESSSALSALLEDPARVELLYRSQDGFSLYEVL